jgi:hypothetical protein
MAASGFPSRAPITRSRRPAWRWVQRELDLLNASSGFRPGPDRPAPGPAVAGVIGKQKPIYDLWAIP